MKRKTSYQLFNSDMDYEGAYEDYKDFCLNNDEEPTEGGFYDWKINEFQLMQEDLFDNIKYFTPNCDFLIEGTLGLWYGKREIEQVCVDTLYNAIMKCLGRSTMEYKIEKKGDRINVTAYHHDGTNEFSIIGLSDKGKEIFEKRGYVSTSRKQNIFELPDYLF